MLCRLRETLLPCQLLFKKRAPPRPFIHVSLSSQSLCLRFNFSSGHIHTIFQRTKLEDVCSDTRKVSGNTWQKCFPSKKMGQQMLCCIYCKKICTPAHFVSKYGGTSPVHSCFTLKLNIVLYMLTVKIPILQGL